MAKGSGRRSAADNNAARFSAVLEPTRKLSAAETAVWKRVMGAWPVDHWIASDAEMMTQYCAACDWFEKARKGHDPSAMDKAGRLCLSYATKLRLTPQSRYITQTAGTHSEHGKENEAGADRLLGRNAWAKLPGLNPN